MVFDTPKNKTLLILIGPNDIPRTTVGLNIHIQYTPLSGTLRGP